jgi:hypothetical protein
MTTDKPRISAGAGAVIVVPLSIANTHDIHAGASAAIVIYDDTMDAASVGAAIREAMSRANRHEPVRIRSRELTR